MPHDLVTVKGSSCGLVSPTFLRVGAHSVKAPKVRLFYFPSPSATLSIMIIAILGDIKHTIDSI